MKPFEFVKSTHSASSGERVEVATNAACTVPGAR